MKVKELIAILEEQSPDAEVLIMSQQKWPFEYDVFGVSVRSEVDGHDREEEGMEGAPIADGREPGDVFIVEGSQLRYGAKAAWDVAVR